MVHPVRSAPSAPSPARQAWSPHPPRWVYGEHTCPLAPAPDFARPDSDPSAGEITVSEWIDHWETVQDVGLSTAENREYLIRRFIRPYWGQHTLNSVTGEGITIWERKLPVAQGVPARRRTRAACCTPFSVTPRQPSLRSSPLTRPSGRRDRAGGANHEYRVVA